MIRLECVLVPAVKLEYQYRASAFLMQAVSCTMAQAAYVAMVAQSKKDLAAESGGRSAFESYGRSAGVQPPSPRANRP